MDVNWLITGGCGFIGRNLVRFLLKNDPDCNIRLFDNLSVGSIDELQLICDFTRIESEPALAAPQGVELVVADILSLESLSNAASGVDVIVHLAANTGVAPSVENPLFDCQANVLGVVHALEAARARKVGKFIFASSGAPVGEIDPPIHEEVVPHPVSPYGASKLAGEGYCSAYHQCYGIGTVALRFGNVYGPLSGKKQSVVARFIGRALQGETLEIYGDGCQTRDFIYVEDLVGAIDKAASALNIGGNIFQIATNSETSLLELTSALVSVFEQNGMRAPEVVHAPTRVGDVMRNYSDTTKAREMLGWQATTELAQGLDATVKFFKEELGKVS